MGCDIHAYFEIKVNGKWLLYDQPNIERNYQLFSKMAGVRGDEDPLSVPKGFPTDASEVVTLEYNWWGTDGHTHSWFNADEISKIIKYHESIVPKENLFRVSFEQWFYLYGNEWEHFRESRSEYPEEIEDIRLVFWFDN